MLEAQKNLPFVVAKSNIEGKGVFASSHIRAGEKICSMQGTPLSIAELREKYRKGEERISDPLQIGPTEYLDLDEPYIFFNHSCEPNAAIVGEHELVAVHDINEGEEITFD